MNATAFRAASEAAERLATAIADARCFLDDGQVRVAYGLLWDGFLDSERHKQVLGEAMEGLAAVSDGVIRHHGAGGLRCYASAHEALREIVQDYYITILLPVAAVEDEAEQEAVMRQVLQARAQDLMLPTADLAARVRRERAKLLAQVEETFKDTEVETDLPKDGTRFKEEDVPAAFRDGGKPDGAVLTTNYLEQSTDWDLRGPYLSRHYGPDKRLTRRIVVGRQNAYLFVEVAALRVVKTANQADQEGG